MVKFHPVLWCEEWHFGYFGILRYSYGVLKQLLKVIYFRTKHSILSSASVCFSATGCNIFLRFLPEITPFPIPSAAVAYPFNHSTLLSIHSTAFFIVSMLDWLGFFSLSFLLKREKPVLLVGTVNFVHRCMLVPFFHIGILEYILFAFPKQFMLFYP